MIKAAASAVAVRLRDFSLIRFFSAASEKGRASSAARRLSAASDLQLHARTRTRACSVAEATGGRAGVIHA